LVHIELNGNTADATTLFSWDAPARHDTTHTLTRDFEPSIQKKYI
jgi:hypothetical protein